MAVEDCSKLLSKIRVLARLEVPPEDCERITEIRGFLEGVRRAGPLVEGLDPLYHVWEAESRLRDPREKGYGHVNIEDLGVETREGYVRLPWRGRL
ncbi:MAG: hypothetical protein F7C33_00315 [Desulfurococcales archaeon]|nr:hypothetical protein [Desulfurococcales archaeon]